MIAAPVKGAMTVQCRGAGAGGERGKGVDGDDQEAGADRSTHAQTQDGDEGGDGEEPAADAEEAGDRAESGARCAGPCGPELLSLRAGMRCL